MSIQRKQFVFPCRKLVDAEVNIGIFRKRMVPYKAWTDMTMDEWLATIYKFIDSVGKENLVNVTESNIPQYVSGNMQIFVSVWHWNKGTQTEGGR